MTIPSIGDFSADRHLQYDLLGTPQYQTPIYAHPAIKEAAHSIGADMSKQSLGLFRISADTIYYPVFDLVYATQPVNIGSESLSGSLKRVVAGIKVVLKDKDNAVLSSSIDSVSVRITNIYSELNYYTENRKVHHVQSRSL